MSTCKKWREEIGSFYENFKNDQTMPEYWKNHTVSYKITMSVYSLFLARKFSNESLHSPAHYHFLICDLSSCADDIHIKLIQYLCTNSKTYKMIFTESESWWHFFEESRGALKNLSCNTLNLFRVNRSASMVRAGGQATHEQLLP